MGVGHYENFPVASLLAPPQLRPAIRAIYRFARTADDIADEGDDRPEARLARLAALAGEIDAIERGAPTQWPDLATAVHTHALPLQPFRDLISAFSQDVTTFRYQSYEALRDYCRRSADPIGRLLLALYRCDDPVLESQADSVCTGLQLTNFWQDVARDWRIGRVYIPLEDMQRCGVDEQAIATQRADHRWCALMRFEVQRARRLLHAGYPLASALGGRIGVELRAVVHGGLRILERIDRVGGDVFRHRPALQMHDWVVVGLRTFASSLRSGQAAAS